MMMRKTEGGEEFTGNDQFEGYCKDMMDLIAAKLGINCTLPFLFHLKNIHAKPLILTNKQMSYVKSRITDTVTKILTSPVDGTVSSAS